MTETTTPITKCDHCDKEVPTAKYFAEDVVWCEACCKEDIALITDYPCFGSGSWGEEYKRWDKHYRADAIRSIKKKQLMTTPINAKCDHCDKEIDRELEETDPKDLTFWCASCSIEDAELIKGHRREGLGPNSNRYQTYTSTNADAVRAIPKKNTQVETTTSKLMVKCDHCDKEVLGFPDYITTDVVWCADCVKMDLALLESAGVNNPKLGEDNRWLKEYNAPKVKAIPKKSTTPTYDKSIDVSAVVLGGDLSAPVPKKMVSCYCCDALCEDQERQSTGTVMTCVECNDAIINDSNLPVSFRNYRYWLNDYAPLNTRKAKIQSIQAAKNPITIAPDTHTTSETSFAPKPTRVYCMCDHCGKDTTIYQYTGRVAWCADCSFTDRQVLKATNIPVLPNHEREQEYWDVSYNVAKVKAIPKKSTSTTETKMPETIPTPPKLGTCFNCSAQTAPPDAKGFQPFKPEQDTTLCKSCITTHYQRLVDVSVGSLAKPENIADDYWAPGKAVDKIKALFLKPEKIEAPKPVEVKVEPPVIGTCYNCSAQVSISKPSGYTAYRPNDGDIALCRSCVFSNHHRLCAVDLSLLGKTKEEATDDYWRLDESKKKIKALFPKTETIEKGAISTIKDAINGIEAEITKLNITVEGTEVKVAEVQAPKVIPATVPCVCCGADANTYGKDGTTYTCRDCASKVYLRFSKWGMRKSNFTTISSRKDPSEGTVFDIAYKNSEEIKSFTEAINFIKETYTDLTSFKAQCFCCGAETTNFNRARSKLLYTNICANCSPTHFHNGYKQDELNKLCDAYCALDQAYRKLFADYKANYAGDSRQRSPENVALFTFLHQHPKYLPIFVEDMKGQRTLDDAEKDSKRHHEKNIEQAALDPNRNALKAGDKVTIEIRNNFVNGGRAITVTGIAIGTVSDKDLSHIYLDQDLEGALEFKYQPNIDACKSLGLEVKDKRAWTINPDTTRLLGIQTKVETILPTLQYSDLTPGDLIEVEIHKDGKTIPKIGFFVGIWDNGYQGKEACIWFDEQFKTNSHTAGDLTKDGSELQKTATLLKLDVSAPNYWYDTEKTTILKRVVVSSKIKSELFPPTEAAKPIEVKIDTSTALSAEPTYYKCAVCHINTKAIEKTDGDQSSIIHTCGSCADKIYVVHGDISKSSLKEVKDWTFGTYSARAPAIKKVQDVFDAQMKTSCTVIKADKDCLMGCLATLQRNFKDFVITAENSQVKKEETLHTDINTTSADKQCCVCQVGIKYGDPRAACPDCAIKIYTYETGGNYSDSTLELVKKDGDIYSNCDMWNTAIQVVRSAFVEVKEKSCGASGCQNPSHLIESRAKFKDHVIPPKKVEVKAEPTPVKAEPTPVKVETYKCECCGVDTKTPFNDYGHLHTCGSCAEKVLLLQGRNESGLGIYKDYTFGNVAQNTKAINEVRGAFNRLYNDKCPLGSDCTDHLDTIQKAFKTHKVPLKVAEPVKEEVKSQFPAGKTGCYCCGEECTDWAIKQSIVGQVKNLCATCYPASIRGSQKPEPREVRILENQFGEWLPSLDKLKAEKDALKLLGSIKIPSVVQATETATTTKAFPAGKTGCYCCGEETTDWSAGPWNVTDNKANICKQCHKTGYKKVYDVSLSYGTECYIIGGNSEKWIPVLDKMKAEKGLAQPVSAIETKPTAENAAPSTTTKQFAKGKTGCYCCDKECTDWGYGKSWNSVTVKNLCDQCWPETFLRRNGNKTLTGESYILSNDDQTYHTVLDQLKLEKTAPPLYNLTINTSELNLPKDRSIITKPTFFDMVKDDTVKAGYRVAATQMSKGVKNAIILALKDKGIEGGKIEAFSEMLDTELGQALISALLGYGLTYIPQLSESPHAQQLAREFRINGMSGAGDVLVNAIFANITEVVKTLPEMKIPELPQPAVIKPIKKGPTKQGPQSTIETTKENHI